MFSKVKRLFSRFFQKTRKNKKLKRGVTFLRSHPFTSFFLSLGLLLVIIILGNVISTLGQDAPREEEVVKPVKTFTIGESPKIALQAQVNQEGIIEVIAQTPGIVQEVFVMEGENVKEGQTLISLSSNYQGGNAPGLQAQLAGVQYKNIKDTYDTQKEIIQKQREVAEKTRGNTQELTDISNEAEGETRGLLEQNESILTTLNEQLTALEASGATGSATLGARQARSQAQAAVNQLRNTLRTLEYQTADDREPSDLADLQRDISLKQLDVQEKALALSKETSRIQYNLALIQASLMRPSAPFKGTVERVLVSPGESVNPGTVIAVISSHNPKASITIMVPREIAVSISRAEPSIVTIGSKEIELTPSYISSVPTNQLLYTVIYNLPEEYIGKAPNNSFIPVEVPIGYADSLSSVPFIPIDSVFQSQSDSIVYLAKNGIATSQEVILGEVFGGYVEVIKGIKDGDEIILDRNVVHSEKVTIEK